MLRKAALVTFKKRRSTGPLLFASKAYSGRRNISGTDKSHGKWRKNPSSEKLSFLIEPPASLSKISCVEINLFVGNL